MKGPTPEQLSEFMTKCELELKLGRMAVYGRLAEEAGMSVKGVRRYFADPASPSCRSCPYSVWRLWNLTIFNTDMKESENG